MKGGQTPIHIQRWAPADLWSDEHWLLLVSRRDYRTMTFYRAFLDLAFMAGGDLPAAPDLLSASLRMPRRDVEHALAYCLGKLIFQDGDRLYQGRVRREIAAELEFRKKQSELGKKGGRPKKGGGGEGEPNPTLLDTESPPAPTPTPTPITTPPNPPARAGGGDAPSIEGGAPTNGHGLRGAVLDEAIAGLVAYWRGLGRFDRGAWTDEPSTVPEERNLRTWRRALRHGRLTVDELRRGIANRVYQQLITGGRAFGDEAWPPDEVPS